MTGVPFSGRTFLRSAAKAGDFIFVTGPLGGSLRHGRHLSFMPRLQISEWLSRTVNVHAMMDLSDGLSLDLYRMMEASQTCAEIIESAVPIHDDVSLELSRDQRLSATLQDGEDFELLFTVNENDAELLSAIAREANVSVHRIGRVTRGSGIDLVDLHGNRRLMPAAGWQHEF